MPTRNHIDLVDKTLRVLEALSRSEADASLKSIADEVGMGKSSVFRILYTLKEKGYVEQAATNGAYALTVKTLALGRRAAGRLTLSNLARPHLTRLRDEVWESAWLAELRYGRVILVDVINAPRRLQLSLDVGDICPLHATAVGKAIAAYMPPAELRGALGRARLPRYTAKTNTSRARFMRELESVREKGYSVNDEETIEGAIVFGAPLFDSLGRAFAGVSVGTLAARCSAERRDALISAILKASSGITRDLSGLGLRSRGAEPTTTSARAG